MFGIYHHFSPPIYCFPTCLIRICSYDIQTFCLYFRTATQCGKGGKGGKGGVASDILERFCEVCTNSKVEVDAVLKAKEKGKTKGITAAAFATTEAMATTDPSSLSTGQIVGIAVGVFVASCMLIRLIKCCCCRKKLD